MKVSKSLFLSVLLAIFVLVAFASPVSENTRDRDRRSEGKAHWLFPRKGGGGGGKGGGGGGAKGGGSTGSHPSKGGSESDIGSSGLRGFYGGGAAVPYRAGHLSPLGLTPFFILPFAAWMPFYWGPYGAYYYLVNQTAPALPNNTAHNTTDPIICVCENYDACGCDDDTTGNYTLPSDAEYAVINGTEYAVVNGTLDNSTLDNSSSESGTTSSGSMGLHLTKSGAWSAWVMLGTAAMFAVQAL